MILFPRIRDVSENLFKNVNISSPNATNPNLNLFKCCSNESDEVAKRDQVDWDCKNGTQLYDHLFINCGGEFVSANGSEYEADLNQRGESTFFKSNSSKWGYSSMGRFLWANRNNYKLNDTCRIHSGDAQLFQTARVSPISLKYYGFCLKNGWYNVYLHFADISSSNNKVLHSKAGRLFDIFIQGDQVQRSFSIKTEANGTNRRTTMKHEAFVKDNLLEIHLYWSGKGSILYPSVYYGPLISAITVAPAQSPLPPGVLGGLSAFALLSLILFIGFSWRYHDKLLEEARERVELYPGGLYNYRKIKNATDGFNRKNKLGEGGFGTVYQGKLSNGTAVAVKTLSETKEGMSEFVEKSRAISGMKHPNLVTLMGCCAGKNQLLLIYEYAGNRSLEDALFGSDELRARLDWPTRYRICLGLAEGLSFLHEQSKHVVIHGDIKPANILDDDLEVSKHVIIHGDIKPANILLDDDLEGSKHVIIHGDIKPGNIPVDDDLEGSKHVIIHGDIKPANIPVDGDLEGSKRVIIYGDIKPANFLLDDDLEGSKRVIIHGDMKPAKILVDDDLEGSKHVIIHGDIKPANILLDDNLNPKIYDFGFAKLYHKQKSEGTRSYTAPEVKDRPLRANADVYSFGVVMLILVSGMNIKTPIAGGEYEYLVEEAETKNRSGALMKLVDPSLGQEYDREEANVILRLAIQCIDLPRFRPTMTKIVKILKKQESI